MFRFNVRVYGVLINESGILVEDAWIRGMRFTKFPGGGLEFGEGTRECLEREFMEEMGLAVSVDEHIYTTDFFQISAWNPEHQIISIYYKVSALEPIRTRISTEPFQFDDDQLAAYEQRSEVESFRFIQPADFNSDVVDLPIDKIVAGLIREQFIH